MIPLSNNGTQEVTVFFQGGKIAIAPEAQSLIDGIAESKVGLLDITVFMGIPRMILRGRHPVVAQQLRVSQRKPSSAAADQLVCGGRQVV